MNVIQYRNVFFGNRDAFFRGIRAICMASLCVVVCVIFFGSERERERETSSSSAAAIHHYSNIN